MKKNTYLAIGILLGIALGVSFSMLADLMSEKDNKVDVIINGSKLGAAIVVDGKSFVPVRDIAEAAGYRIDLQDEKIVLIKKPSVQMYLEGIHLAEKRLRELEKSRESVRKALEDMSRGSSKYTAEEIKRFQARLETLQYDQARLEQYKAVAEQKLQELTDKAGHQK